MARGKADISNVAIRVFLQDVGAFYDKVRGLDPYKGHKLQKQQLLDFFASRCCYCDSPITVDKFSQDHLIPMNKDSLGLHSWGNVVPCCSECNARKHNQPWGIYLVDSCKKNTEIIKIKREKLLEFIKIYHYEPNLQLGEIARNLYDDIGEVALTLIRLRYQQAESVINSLVKSNEDL